MLDSKYHGKSEGKNHSRLHRFGKTASRASRKYHYALEKERIYIFIMGLSAFQSLLILILGFSKRDSEKKIKSCFFVDYPFTYLKYFSVIPMFNQSTSPMISLFKLCFLL